MNVMSVANWVAVSEYQPVARINKPISDFAHQFHTATVFITEGTSGLLFCNKDRQFILRELADNDQTELLVPVKTAAAKAPSCAGKVEDALVNAMRELGVRLPHVASLREGLDRDRLQVVMGFGLRAGSFDSRPPSP